MCISGLPLIPKIRVRNSDDPLTVSPPKCWALAPWPRAQTGEFADVGLKLRCADTNTHGIRPAAEGEYEEHVGGHEEDMWPSPPLVRSRGLAARAANRF